MRIYLDNCCYNRPYDDQKQIRISLIYTERFISNLLRESFDYTEWRKKYFADVDLETFLNEAAEYSKAHPFRGGKNFD